MFLWPEIIQPPNPISIQTAVRQRVEEKAKDNYNANFKDGVSKCKELSSYSSLASTESIATVGKCNQIVYYFSRIDTGEIKLKGGGGENRVFGADNHIKEPENLCSVAFSPQLPL